MAGLLNISEMGALALHTMLQVANRKRQGYDDWLNVGDLAVDLQASRHTLHKVTKMLVQAGFLESARGPSGGVRLLARPQDIRIADIIEAVEGPLATGGCLFERRVCSPVAVCQFCGITADLQQSVWDYFTGTTLHDLVKRLPDGGESPESENT